jgi:hypothetical protein
MGQESSKDGVKREKKNPPNATKTTKKVRRQLELLRKQPSLASLPSIYLLSAVSPPYFKARQKNFIVHGQSFTNTT